MNIEIQKKVKKSGVTLPIVVTDAEYEVIHKLKANSGQSRISNLVYYKSIFLKGLASEAL